MANIVTFGTASATEQKEFVLNIISVLCPSGDINEVYQWTETNVGSKASCIVNGIDYLLGLGPVGNILMNVNEDNWANWDLSL